MMEQRNLILAIVISIAILVGFQFFFDQPKPPAPAPQTASSPAATPAIPGAAPVSLPVLRERTEILADNPRVTIETPRTKGSIALVGGRIDDIVLTGYRETVDPNSPQVTLLHPLGAKDAYYAEFGWSTTDTSQPVPSQDTRWTADFDKLTPTQPVTLTWDNGKGLTFIRQYTVDKDYMITVTQRVDSKAATPVVLHPYALASRSGTPITQDFFILHEGAIGVLGDVLQEHKYSELREKPEITGTTKGGWLGFTDKYWLVALIPDQADSVKTSFRYSKPNGIEKFQVDYLGDAKTLAPGGSVEANHRLFAGAKEVSLLQRYETDLKINRFDYAVDWGWFFFFTKPIFQLMEIIYHQVGNFGICILVLTVIIKLLFFPLANRSYVTMSKMKKLTPVMQELREKYAGDNARMQQELMGLYKREKINPLSGCLPIVAQIPVFFALYKVLFVTIEMRHAPFFGWIQDLSAADPTTVFNLFGLIPWAPPHFLMIGAWPLIMGVTMWLQMKLNPTPTDPIQAKMFMIMPVVFTFMLGSFPAGLVIYWAWNNTLSIAQQWVIMRRLGAA
ncbi:MAG: membrane protein insertase YidC [Elstera cyanobacteriorum]|nr:membrane protein insertase YidC [Elstera cyanobacteriorum]MCK6443191.1 membrane protein insertase YidC [Elstera cyanobacteriorum]